MSIAWRKVFRDMWIFKGRTLLALVGMLVGTAAIGAVLSAYTVLNRELARNYMDTNPASLRLTVQGLDTRALGIVEDAYPTAAVDVSKTVQARISRGDGTWGTIFLRAVPAFGSQCIDTFDLERGSWPDTETQMALERDCLKILPDLRDGTGETVLVKMPGGREQSLRIEALAHAPGLAPASMENYSYGFVRLQTLNLLGYGGWYDELRIISAEDRLDLKKMQAMAGDVRRLLASAGYTVSRVDVPPPGKHPHADQLSSLLFLLQAFSVIALLAAGLIVLNLMNFIMSRQTKQIAVQKAVGGTARQISLPYFVYVLAIGFAAFTASLPLSLAMGRGYAAFAAGILNFDIQNAAVPIWVYGVQALTSLLLPALAAARPIRRACASSVRDGLSEQISAPRAFGERKHGNPATRRSAALAMPARNLMRKKARTALAVLALAAGGMLFMTAQNITASIDSTVEASIGTFRWDYDIRLAANYDKESLRQALAGVGELDRAEIWQGSAGFFRTGEGAGSTAYTIKIAPEGSQLIRLPGLDTAGDAIIVNKALADEEKWLTGLNTVPLEAGGTTAEVKILRVVDEVPAIPAIYITQSAYERLFGSAPRQMLMAVARTRDVLKQRTITKEIEAKFAAAGVTIAESWNIHALRKAFVDHLKVIVTFLSTFAALAVAVGGLGIGSAVGINVSERRRETGVLRAIGATPRAAYALILAEVLIMGLAGWLAGAMISYPASVLVGNYFGQIFLHTNLVNVMSVPGTAIWLVISMAVSLLAGYLPARSASRAPLRELLAYE